MILKVLYVSTVSHNSIQFLLSVIILLNLLSLCRPQPSNTNNQTFISANSLNPVINILQLLFNNKTQLQFKSYPPIKEYNAELHDQNRSSLTSNLSELIYIGEDYFDYQHCLLKYLPSLNDPWFAFVDLKQECSSIEVIHSILKLARTVNGSHLKGILFFVDVIPRAPSLHYLVNQPGTVNCRPLCCFC